MAGERRARGQQDGPGLTGRRDHARWIRLFTICSSSLRTTCSSPWSPCGRRHGVDKSRHPGKLRCDAFPCTALSSQHARCMACGTPASVAHRRLASVRPISTTARRTCGRTSPPGPRVCTALATTLRTERTARVTAFAASFGAGDGLGQFDYFLPRLLDAGAEALFVIHSGGFVLTARACCFCLRRGLGRGMASRFTGQLVCCSCGVTHPRTPPTRCAFR